mgnify:CR=1 FL=1
MKKSILPDTLLDKMKSAVESSMDGIALLDAGGNYIYLNDVHLSMFGYSKEEELIGKSWETIYGPEEIARINASIFPLLMEQKKWRGETTGINKAGLPVFQEITLTIQEDGGIICICRDIEQRLHNQQQMRRHEKILEQSKSMLIITNKKRTNCNN